MILTTSEESRLLDQRAMTEYGLPESVLMENAGASVVQLMKEKTSWEDARVVIVCLVLSLLSGKFRILYVLSVTVHFLLFSLFLLPCED